MSEFDDWKRIDRRLGSLTLIKTVVLGDRFRPAIFPSHSQYATKIHLDSYSEGRK